jgi:hypothetical protein
MGKLQRIHSGFILGGFVLRAFRRIAFALLLTAGGIWLTQRSFTERPATVLTVCIVIWFLRAAIRAIGELLGPPEPLVKTGTQLEKRRALRRAGMLGRR